MSEGSFSETTNTNFFQRMGKSLIGALVGVILFLVSFIVLFWNEGRAVDTARSLAEAGGVVVDISADKVDPANNDKLVHLSGEATTNEVLSDDLFRGIAAQAVPSDKVDPANNGKLVSVTGEATSDEILKDGLFPVSAKALRLLRKVEMLQWQEEEQDEGGSEQANKYTKVWSSKLIDSKNFDAAHKNKSLPLSSKTESAKVVKLGAFELSPELVAQLDKADPLAVTEEEAKKATGQAKEFSWKSSGGVLYTGDPKNPAPGDLKVSFAVVKPQKVTVMAAQKDNSFVPFQPNAAEEPVYVLKAGDLSSQGVGISAKAIRLERKVEMYQYEEKSKTETRNKPVGGGQEQVTTYSYSKVWKETPNNSQSFHNPAYQGKNPDMPFKSKTYTAKVVKLGAFELSPELISQIHKSEPLPATEADARMATGPARKFTWTSEGGVLYSGSPSAPQVGDLKVSFAVVKPLKVSVLAAQRNNTFAAFQPKSASNQINRLDEGEKTAQAMIKEMEAENTTMTWILRLVGFVCMAVGIFLVLSPLSEFTNIIPFLGGIFAGGISILIGIFAFLVALVLSLITIAIAWLFYRPLLAVGLLAGAAVVGVLVVMLIKKARKPAIRPG
jgi:hypothetical protein